jgi:NADPH:quinone reductase-like Zn-dependent oxidoreductase
MGAKTIGVTRTRKKVKRLEAAGYDAIVVSEEGDVAKQILAITSGGADFVFDPVGGPALTELVESVKTGGELNVYGALDPNVTPLPIFSLMRSGAKIGSYMSRSTVLRPRFCTWNPTRSSGRSS